MLARPSFLADIVMPSASDAISRTMSGIGLVGVARLALLDEPGVLGEAAGVQEERERRSGRRPRAPRGGWPCDTGWPPIELLVTVMNTTGTSSAPRSSMQALQGGDVHVALEGQPSRPRPAAVQGRRASAPVASTLARVVSKWVLLGTTLPGPADAREEDLLGGAALVGGDDVLEREELLDRVAEAEPRRRAGVALVAVLDARPLVAAHRARARVGQQVDDHVVGVEVEEVVARFARQACRSSRVDSRMGSTEWMRNGSMMVCQRSTLAG